jgi:muramoyltetrapeptide carboxypeptidase LdcA involved in peptidoglycan recycling
MKYQKPLGLKKGDTVAVLSPSWAGPGTFPHVYENGIKVLKEWGLEVKECTTTRASNEFLYNNPKARAKDINAAFKDSSVKAIIASIGGEDSIRILPFLDENIIKKNPKIFMGFSDTTTILTFLNTQGLVTFYGPSIMAGFSQMENLPKEFKIHVHDMLFNPRKTFEYLPYTKYCEGYLDWSKKENVGMVNKLKFNKGWRVIQGDGIAKGQLFGGCIEVLEFMKGTDFWPSDSFWKNKILFFETSEEKPTVMHIKRMLRNYGMQGIFNKVSAILFARPRDYSDKEKADLEKAIKEVVGVEFNKPNLPIMSNLDFGHTDPQFILPMGVNTKIDFSHKKIELIESWIK